MHSSQNEQDSRFYAKFAFFPASNLPNQQEAYDMVFDAFELFRKIQIPVLLRIQPDWLIRGQVSGYKTSCASEKAEPAGRSCPVRAPPGNCKEKIQAAAENIWYGSGTIQDLKNIIPQWWKEKRFRDNAVDIYNTSWKYWRNRGRISCA